MTQNALGKDGRASLPRTLGETARHELCIARARGTYFWYWRHDQDDDAMRASLAMLDDGC